MARMKVTVAYDGTDFAGYQIQPSGRTVQGSVQAALKKIHKGEFVPTSASGRTDAGVHAIGQVIHFDTNMDIPATGWLRGLNAILPKDIQVRNVEEVDESFHARFSSVSKEYHYKLLTGNQPDIFKRNHAFYYPYRLNRDDIKIACAYFLGTHDFTSFSSVKTHVTNKVRTIYELSLIEDGEELTFKIKGSGFLYNMVRIIVGTLLDVGQGRKRPEDIKTIIQREDRAFASKTAPAHGLYLHQVSYEEEMR
jgi:tRNA pseudouridine38-40 synthase